MFHPIQAQRLSKQARSLLALFAVCCMLLSEWKNGFSLLAHHIMAFIFIHPDFYDFWMVDDGGWGNRPIHLVGNFFLFFGCFSHEQTIGFGRFKNEKNPYHASHQNQMAINRNGSFFLLFYFMNAMYFFQLTDRSTVIGTPHTHT